MNIFCEPRQQGQKLEKMKVNDTNQDSKVTSHPWLTLFQVTGAAF